MPEQELWPSQPWAGCCVCTDYWFVNGNFNFGFIALGSISTPCCQSVINIPGEHFLPWAKLHLTNFKLTLWIFNYPMCLTNSNHYSRSTIIQGTLKSFPLWKSLSVKGRPNECSLSQMHSGNSQKIKTKSIPYPFRETACSQCTHSMLF